MSWKVETISLKGEKNCTSDMDTVKMVREARLFLSARSDLVCNVLVSTCAVLMTVPKLTFAGEIKCADDNSYKDH